VAAKTSSLLQNCSLSDSWIERGRRFGTLGVLPLSAGDDPCYSNCIFCFFTYSISTQLPNCRTIFQVGNLSFFNNAANRGSLRKLLSRGSTFVPISPLSRWV
jgi:hypothetical protein